MRVASLHARGGGFLLGALQAGMEPVFAWDPNMDAALVLASNFNCLVRNDLPSASSIPHAEIVVCSLRHGAMGAGWQAISATTPRAVVVEGPASMHASFERLGYKCLSETLSATDFGVPQKRRHAFVIAIRSDVTPKLRFEPPDPQKRGKFGDVMDQMATETLSKDALASIDGRNQRTLASGRRHVVKTITPEDLAPTLTSRLGKDGYVFLVRGENGTRYPTHSELLGTMGFPKGYRYDLPPTKFKSLLWEDMCPPVAKALLTEIRDWLA
jgi:site-specific DNA-cytosine methylase